MLLVKFFRLNYNYRTQLGKKCFFGDFDNLDLMSEASIYGIYTLL